MQYITAPVHTFCMGMAASMGSLLLAGGEKGNRYALKNSTVMIHRELWNWGINTEVVLGWETCSNERWGGSLMQLVEQDTPLEAGRMTLVALTALNHRSPRISPRSAWTLQCRSSGSRMFHPL